MTEIGDADWADLMQPLRGFILKRVGDDDDADDILQDVLLKAHTRFGQLGEMGRLKAWLYQIARNAIIDFQRRRSPEVDLPEGWEELIPDGESSLPEVKDEMQDAVEGCLLAMIDRLPETYREPVRMTELQGMTQKEVGEKLGLSVSGAKSRVQRGRERLKKILLACCEFEVDRYGHVLEVRPKDGSCQSCE